MKYDRNRPIGILDSGIGGFSVVRQIQRELPKESLLYFGDGANVPYGNHSKEQILSMARYMFEFMEQHEVKALMVACNTISCLVDGCRDVVSCPVFTAVEAGAEAAAGMEVNKVGVISTVFTHNSRCYPREIQRRSPRKLVVLSCGCPDLAQLVEHNLGDPIGMDEVERNIRMELDGMVLGEQIQCCVLGCTHYPLVEDRIQRLYPDLPLIDPAKQMVQNLNGYLQRESLNCMEEEMGTLSIYTTGDVSEYTLRAKQVGLQRMQGVYAYPPMK